MFPIRSGMSGPNEFFRGSAISGQTPLNRLPMPTREGLAGVFNRAFFWTEERTTVPYDLWVMAILAFVWLTPPDWLGDPTANGRGLGGWLWQLAVGN